MSYDTFVNLFAGGLGGTFGAIITCPLEVVKTRLQSSVATFDKDPPNCKPTTRNKQLTIWNCIRHIINTEGPKALFKGLGPNILGVAPSRAIYFCAYSQTKTWCNQKVKPDTPLVHMISAACAGFVSCTLTNPIWLIKTRMQLDQSLQGLSTWDCIKNVHRTSGLKGFYKGITASYVGISETMIHFVMYELIKVKLFDYKPDPIIPIGITPTILPPEETKGKQLSFIQYSVSAAMAKTFASIVAYPHEVVRTRLREEGDKYRRFVQTLQLVYKEEGIRNGLYRGLATQLIRQIPNTAVMMGTYEVVVYFMKNLPFSLRSDGSSQHNNNT